MSWRASSVKRPASGEKRAALVAVGQRIVLDEMPAQDRSLRGEVRIRLDACKAGLRRGQGGSGQADPIEVRDHLGWEAKQVNKSAISVDPYPRPSLQGGCVERRFAPGLMSRHAWREARR